MTGRPIHAMTVDVEDYYQVSGMEDRVCRSDWDQLESRVERSTDRMLSLFDEVDVRGTFFILGWVAERFPALVKRIARAGHEIASHGYWHRLVYEITPDEFAKDISDSCDAIYTACGVRPTAYRAPSFSIIQDSLWALDILVEHGFTDDSSIFPIAGHDRYGVPGSRKDIHTRKTTHGPIREYPPSIARFGKAPVPVGGGYFRLLPLHLTIRAIQSIEKKHRPAMFYIHPWEIDPEQPRVKGLRRSAAFRHYIGLERTERKLRRMMNRLSFGTMTESRKNADQHQKKTADKRSDLNASITR
ncbi:XrtA system polysaccharide deacetylase [Planctomycetes bacterium TBK1r]|uniref:Peptidoglycan deacetylase n=1 Tax=Stieleria magnilauensis TaxID=2527963 RepID=A0ABX5XLQ5_9BACT|nr:Peptidoglycan deacetylase [Planctomycetes bacterium TBK1r]